MGQMDFFLLAATFLGSMTSIVVPFIMTIIFSQNAPTQSFLRVVNGILDESIERKRGEIPHRVVYLLRNVVQEIEHRISIQADHIRNQNNITKTREDKYCSKIKALETLVNGTNEENEMAINRQEAAIFRDNTWFTIHRKLLVAGIVAYIF